MTAIGINGLFQAISLILLARNLGPAEFAVIVAAAASAAIAAEFVGLGSGDLLIRDVSRNPDAHRKAFGQGLWLMGLTFVPFCLAATFAAERWFSSPASIAVLATLVASEIVAIRFAWLTEQVAIAHLATHTATINRIFASGVRFVAVCAAVFLAGISTAAEWSLFALLSSAILALGCVAISVRRFGPPDFGRKLRANPYEGILFSLMQIIRAAQFSLDKFAVAAIAPSATVGTFGAASRVAQLGTMPANAVTRMTYPTFFKEGVHGIGAAMVVLRRIAPTVFALSLLSSSGLIGIAYLLPFLLGAEFADAKTYVLMLAPIPLASALQNLGGDLLSGSDLQSHRTITMATGLFLTAIACFVGAQFAGLIGTVIGYVVGHFFYAGVTWLMIWRLLRLHSH